MTMLDRVRALLEYGDKDDYPRHCHIANGMLLQHLADSAENGTLRRVPRCVHTSGQLRKMAVDEFNLAGRLGFVDC